MSEERLYLGVDVGGTKVLAALVDGSGTVRGRERCPTPRGSGPETVIDAIETAMETAVKSAGCLPKNLTAIGIAIPGVVDTEQARIVVTPNMNLSGVEIGSHLQNRFKVPVAVGNDCNLGALGECWLGSARKAKSVMAILVGTGIGGGIVRKGKLWTGARESAAEIGHIVMQVGGPECGCGNLGCLEALASRTAIERDIRTAVEAGRTTILSTLLNNDFSVIRSGMIRRAMATGDELVTEVLRNASEVIGHACLTVRHLLDPEVIVLGGGVVEANADFMLPIIENVVGNDQLPGARAGGRVLLSALGDDAVVLGAVALARRKVGRNPFKKRYRVAPKYPEIQWSDSGEVTVAGRAYDRDVYLPVSGKVKRRDKTIARHFYESSHVLGPKELKKVCKGGPALLVVASGREGNVELNEEGRRYLEQRSIQCEVQPTAEAIQTYNKAQQRKAILIHVSC